MANTDTPGRSVLVNLVSEMNRSPSLVAAERPKIPLSAQEFFFLPDRILLHGEIAVGEVVTGEIVLGKLRWGNDLTHEKRQENNLAL